MSPKKISKYQYDYLKKLLKREKRNGDTEAAQNIGHIMGECITPNTKNIFRRIETIQNFGQYFQYQCINVQRR